MRFRLLSTVLLLGACGGVSSSDEDASTADAAAADAAAIDAAIDADTCPDLVAPAGSLPLHPRFCAGGTALGFNPGANPTTMTLSCPTAVADPGIYGAILQPMSATQADGCDGSEPLEHLLTPTVDGALTQLSTTEDLVIATGDRLGVRVSCPTGVADCRAQLQITGSSAPGMNNLIFPEGGGFELITGTTVLDVDIELPPGVVGNTSKINFIVRSDGAGNASVLFGNAHIAKP